MLNFWRKHDLHGADFLVQISEIDSEKFMWQWVTNTDGYVVKVTDDWSAFKEVLPW